MGPYAKYRNPLFGSFRNAAEIGGDAFFPCRTDDGMEWKLSYENVEILVHIRILAEVVVDVWVPGARANWQIFTVKITIHSKWFYYGNQLAPYTYRQVQAEMEQR